jgi:hypothetical protein
MSLSHSRRAEVPIGDYVVPIGPARLARPGTDVTVVAVGSMVPVALQAADALASEGVETEVIDLRSLAPWDAEMVVASVRKSSRWWPSGRRTHCAADRPSSGSGPRRCRSRAGHCANMPSRTPKRCGVRS